MLRAAMLLIAASAILCIVGSMGTSAAGRELSEREKWLTFGGANNKICAIPPQCTVDPQNDCNNSYAESGEIECVTTEHDVGGYNDDECVNWLTGWQCYQSGEMYQCYVQLECVWDEEMAECSQKPNGIIPGSQADGPGYCTSFYQGP